MPTLTRALVLRRRSKKQGIWRVGIIRSIYACALPPSTYQPSPHTSPLTTPIDLLHRGVAASRQAWRRARSTAAAATRPPTTFGTTGFDTTATARASRSCWPCCSCPLPARPSSFGHTPPCPHPRWSVGGNHRGRSSQLTVLVLVLAPASRRRASGGGSPRSRRRLAAAAAPAVAWCCRFVGPWVGICGDPPGSSWSTERSID